MCHHKPWSLCVATNVTFGVPCQRGTLPALKHLTLPSISALLENIITDRRRTNGRERDTNTQQLTASRAFNPLLILCTSFSNSAKLVKEKEQIRRRSLSVALRHYTPLHGFKFTFSRTFSSKILHNHLLTLYCISQSNFIFSSLQ